MTTAIAKNMFSPVVWNIVCGSLKPASIRKTDRADTSDLLASLADSETKPGKLLRDIGVTFGVVMSCVEYHKQRYGPELEIDPENVAWIFSTEGRAALAKTIQIASSQDKSQAMEDDLFIALAGINDLNPPNLNSVKIIQRILFDLHKTSGDLDRAYRASKAISVPVPA